MEDFCTAKIHKIILGKKAGTKFLPKEEEQIL